MSAPLMAAVAASSLILAIPVLVAADTLAAGARAAAAADAAALATADAAVGFALSQAEPCALAAHIASLHDASLIDCMVNAETGEARVQTSIRVGLIRAVRSARAGPP